MKTVIAIVILLVAAPGLCGDGIYMFDGKPLKVEDFILEHKTEACWEYFTAHTIIELEEALQEMGKKKWELIFFENKEGYNMIFKRPIKCKT